MALGVCIGIGVRIGVRIGVGIGVGVCIGVRIGVRIGVGIGVGVCIGVRIGVRTGGRRVAMPSSRSLISTLVLIAEAVRVQAVARVADGVSLSPQPVRSKAMIAMC